MALAPHLRNQVPSLPKPLSDFGPELFQSREESMRQGCWNQGPPAKQQPGWAMAVQGGVARPSPSILTQAKTLSNSAPPNLTHGCDLPTHGPQSELGSYFRPE